MSRIHNKGRDASGFSSRRFSQNGFSLIELMVASAIGLMIMAAILTLYLNVSRTNDEMSKTNALIENGRFAIQVLQNEIAHAGFWDVYIPDFDDLTLPPKTATSAGTAPVAIPSGVPQPCLALSSWNNQIRTNRLGIAVQVHDSVPTGCGGTGGVVTNRKSGTDVLVVRHAHTVPTCLPSQTVGCEAEVSGRLYFQASRCEGENAYKLDVAGLNLTQRDCTTTAPKRRYISNIYYIRDYAVTAGDGIPTLVRSAFDLDGGVVKATAPVALIEGVEGFRVDLGIDRVSDAGIDVISNGAASNRWTAAVSWADADHLVSPVNRGDGVPDEFVHCVGTSNCDENVLVNVVAVKLSLLVRSQTATQGYLDNKSYTLGSQTISAANDGFKRHAFSTVVRLNNVSGRRETP